MFLRTRWYAAALSQEVTRFAPVSRMYLGERVVLFRTIENVAVALEDRCPHRFSPLSLGRMTNNGISCAYHGMTFNAAGICTANPTQPNEAIPPHTRVKSYPLEERHGVVWIWMGEPEEADPTLIPDFYYFDHSDYSSKTDYMHVNCNYLLLVDNLIDLTHINFVHGDIFGSPEMQKKTTSKTVSTERGLVERWWIPSSLAAPIYRELVADPWINSEVDYRLDMYWEPASNLLQDFCISPAGAPMEEGTRVYNLNCLTPETATTTHYFWGQSHRKRSDSTAYGALIMKGAGYAFGQDKALLEAVQRNLGNEWDILEMHPVINKSDRGALCARRMLRKMIEPGQLEPEVAERKADVLAAE
jgi:phenylpropionate dioxygenase-like ring-hydroxylating dioxygenase large terminal subunit